MEILWLSETFKIFPFLCVNFVGVDVWPIFSVWFIPSNNVVSIINWRLCVRNSMFGGLQGVWIPSRLHRVTHNPPPFTWLRGSPSVCRMFPLGCLVFGERWVSVRQFCILGQLRGLVQHLGTRRLPPSLLLSSLLPPLPLCPWHYVASSTPQWCLFIPPHHVQQSVSQECRLARSYLLGQCVKSRSRRLRQSPQEGEKKETNLLEPAVAGTPIGFFVSRVFLASRHANQLKRGICSLLWSAKWWIWIFPRFQKLVSLKPYAYSAKPCGGSVIIS